MTWLGDTGYDHCGLYIHGVKYTKKNGEVLHGTFLPILFESLTDPIITGREEIAAPKWGCNIDISTAGDSRSVRMSWRGTTFAEIDWNGLHDESTSNGSSSATSAATLPKPEPDNGMFMYRYVPAVGEPGKADAEYAVFEEFEKTNDTPEKPEQDEQGDVASKFSVKGENASQTARSASVRFSPGTWQSLPTLHHITQGLADVPVYEILEATVKEVPSVGDVRRARRIE